MGQHGEIRYTKRGASAVITIADARRLNALTMAMWRDIPRRVVEAVADAASRAVARCYESADYAEGRLAFLQKRQPVFKGR